MENIKRGSVDLKVTPRVYEGENNEFTLPDYKKGGLPSKRSGVVRMALFRIGGGDLIEKKKGKRRGPLFYYGQDVSGIRSSPELREKK